jgi:choline dehydrogenase-like flavoprotein
VLVLESGHFAADPEKQRLNEIECTGAHLLSAVDGRKRAVGGTTIAWGGQSLPFSPLDFEARPWVEDSGWPFGSDALLPHYKQANRAMGIDTLDYGAEIFDLLGIRPLPFDSSQIRFHFSKWAPDPNFRRIFARQIESDFTVLYNCQFVDIEIEGSCVRAVIGRNSGGNAERFPCARLIVAAGGLETNRLLLWLQSRHRFLTPDQQARLGTGFMEHPSVYAGTVTPRNEYGFQKAFNTQVHRRRRYSLRLSAAEEWLRRCRRLNVTAAFVMQRPDDAFDPYTEFRDFAKLWATRGSISLTARSFSTTAWALAKDRFIYKCGGIPTLSLCAEQAPSPTNRLTLAERVDAFGMPTLSLHWQPAPATWEAITDFAQVVQAEVARLDLGTVHLREELTNPDEPRLDLLYDIGHHMGGTAMGANPCRSVVDPDLLVRGLKNTWVCSASAFPTGSHSNPTLTVLALADRLAQHLLKSR